MADKRQRDFRRRKNEPSKPFLQAPIILDRREKPESIVEPEIEQDVDPNQAIPFLRRPNKFNIEAISKALNDQPGHFVVSILGKQGVGKSTLLSQFAPIPEQTFATQSNLQFLYKGHKTDGIDMCVTPERAILLDCEPVLCWSIMDKVLKSAGSMENLHPDLWAEMESIYNTLFMLSCSNVVLVVMDGPEIDADVLKLLQRVEILKLSPQQSDFNYNPDIVFVCNKLHKKDYTWENYMNLQNNLKTFFDKSQLKTKGLISLGTVLPSFQYEGGHNLFFLTDMEDNEVESFQVLVSGLRDQVIAAPRRASKKGQISEKEWFRHAIKTFELLHKSDHITDYLHFVRKLRDS
ncbi:hypothetical protein K501DRAFT_324544 [Backusella circina FSU 941]|nr:hypothetical protein K501DRAFT_324544 [Backusella circina FSU 941]